MHPEPRQTMDKPHSNLTLSAPSDVGGIIDVVARIRRWFAPSKAEEGSRVTDEVLLRQLHVLDERQLADIGIYRKPRHISLLWLARGLGPISMTRFDYFWGDATGR